MRIRGIQVAAFLLLALTLTLWPGRPDTGLRPAAAQERTTSGEGLTGGARAAGTGSAGRAAGVARLDLATEDKLNQTIDVGFHETPLSEVVDFLGQSLGLQFYVDRKAFEEAASPSDPGLTLELQQVRGSTALDLLLKPVGLGYVVRDGFVIVSTSEALKQVTEVRVYNCRDLLDRLPPMLRPGTPAAQPPLPGAADGAPQLENRTSSHRIPPGMSAQTTGMGGGGGGQAYAPAPRTEDELRAEKLISIVEVAVAPDSWESAGGVGTIAEFAGLLVVNNHPRAHAEVDQLLRMLREASADVPGTVAGPSAHPASGATQNPAR